MFNFKLSVSVQRGDNFSPELGLCTYVWANSNIAKKNQVGPGYNFIVPFVDAGLFLGADVQSCQRYLGVCSF